MAPALLAVWAGGPRGRAPQNSFAHASIRHSAYSMAARGHRFIGDQLCLVRLLGTVHLGAGLSLEPGFARRRGHGARTIDRLDPAHANRRVSWYTLFGFLADRFGRRPVFLAFVLCAALLVPMSRPVEALTSARSC